MRYDRQMLRTRDLALFVAIVGFLVVAIVATLLLSHTPGVAGGTVSTVIFDDTTATYTVAVAPVVDPTQARLVALRKKMQAEGLSSAALEPEPVSLPSESSATTSEEVIAAPVETKIEMCDVGYSSKTIPGLTGMQLYREQAGQRIFYTLTPDLAPASTSLPAATESVVFRLPLRTVPLAFTSCIKADIVAITPSGIPIRNSDYVQYQGSGESTLIGYTLDGYQLYGQTSSITTDACGGAVVDGSYRYYVSAERNGVIGCFAGIPVTL